MVAIRQLMLSVKALLIIGGGVFLSACATNDELFAQYNDEFCPVERETKSILVNNASTVITIPEPQLEKMNMPMFHWQQAVYFDNAEHILTEDQQKLVLANAELLKENKHFNVVILGFTDTNASYWYNYHLSIRRAEYVIGLLRQTGLDMSRVHMAGLGETVPINENSTEEELRLNRRVEMVFLNTSPERSQTPLKQIKGKTVEEIVKLLEKGEQLKEGQSDSDDEAKPANANTDKESKDAL